MNLRAKFVISIGLLGLLCLMLPGSLRADTVYTYTGNPFTSCTGTICTDDPPAVSVTFDVLAGTPLDNLTTYTTLDPYVTYYSFSDGAGLDLPYNILGGQGLFDIIVETDAAGNITKWSMFALQCAPNLTACYDILAYISTQNDAIHDAVSGSAVGGTGDSYTAGTWTKGSTSPTPEPSSNLLLGTGLLGLLALAARSKRHAPPTSCGSGSG